MVQATYNQLPDLDDIIHDLMSVNNLLPNVDEAPFSFSPDQLVSDAIAEMNKRGLNQVPVASANGEILGVFSFRSFAETVTKPNFGNTPIRDIPVEEFLERPKYIPVEEDISSIIDDLLTKGYLVVGTPKLYQGVLTLSDTALGLHKIALAFILVQHIEIILRTIIHVCIPESVLTNLLNKIKSPYPINDINDTTFGNKRHMVKDNWTYFEDVFGQNSYDRTMVKLKDINDIRNDVFHFNDQKEIDLSQLQVYRDWLVLRAKHYNASNGGESHE